MKSWRWGRLQKLTSSLTRIVNDFYETLDCMISNVPAQKAFDGNSILPGLLESDHEDLAMTAIRMFVPGVQG